ncbi:hypothetical protein JI58_08530 [Marinosulfonomonas sp. PRT-SC04]|nr:hypothetical protein JI58_08530 [Marinosulfonomonas sp. PRT-SC04]
MVTSFQKIGTKMEITSVSLGSSQPKNTSKLAVPDDFRSNIMELDTNGDGLISDGEFATYRAQKQASGQFTPQDGPMPNGPMHEKMQQAMFDALLTRDD